MIIKEKQMKKFLCFTFIFALAVSAAFAGGSRDAGSGGVDTVTSASAVFDYSHVFNETGSRIAAADSVRTDVMLSRSGSTGSVNSAAGSNAVTNNSTNTINIPATTVVRGEATIVIYTSMYQDVIENIKAELGNAFPQYNFTFVYGETGAIQNKIEGERGSGKLGCDILLVAEPSYSIEMKANKMLHNYRSKEVSSLAFGSDPEGYWYPVRISNMVLAFNPEKNARNTLPATFYGFANDERVRGAISMSSPIISGTTTATVAALLEKYGYAYYSALSKQNVAINNYYDAMDKLESGEYKLIMVLEESILRRRQQQGSKLEIIYPGDGIVMIPSTIMIINDKWSANKNAAAAEAVSDWFLSPAGQNAIVSGWMHSVRDNFNRLPEGARATNEIRANSIRVNWDFVFRQRDMIRIRFENQVVNRN
jgi:iron(III) transport system substrate-binding protein